MARTFTLIVAILVTIVCYPFGWPSNHPEQWWSGEILCICGAFLSWVNYLKARRGDWDYDY